VKLNVLERLLLLNLLPAEGDLTTIRIVRQLREELSFSEEEHAKLKFRTAGENQIRWEDDVVDDKEFDFAAKATGTVVSALEKLIKDKKVQEQHISLFDKFKVEQKD
jgi:hypothetical protein